MTAHVIDEVARAAHLQGLLPVSNNDTSQVEPSYQSNLSIFMNDLPDSHQQLFFRQIYSFREFPKLPLELRRKIWGYTVPQGQTFNICCEGPPSNKRVMPVITAMVNREVYEAVMSHYTSGPVTLAGSVYWLSHYDKIRFQQNILHYFNIFKVTGELINAASGVRTIEVYCRNYYCWPQAFGLSDAKEAFFWRAMKLDGLKELRLIVRGKATFNPTGANEPKNVEQLGARFEGFFRLFGGKNDVDKALPDPKIVIIDERANNTAGVSITA